MIEGTFPAGIKPKGFQALAVSATAVALTVPSGAVRAIIAVEAQPIRWRDDGTNPSATVGFLEVATSRFTISGKESLLAFKAIKDGATDSALSVVYYG